MSPKSKIAARLVRALAICQRVMEAPPMITLHVTRKSNNILDVPSRVFCLGHRWNFPINAECLSRFSKKNPIPQGNYWQLFVIAPRIVTRVIFELRILPLKMDVWHRLLTIGKVFWKKRCAYAALLGVNPYL